jgi:hypothetical protein
VNKDFAKWTFSDPDIQKKYPGIEKQKYVGNKEQNIIIKEWVLA